MVMAVLGFMETEEVVVDMQEAEEEEEWAWMAVCRLGQSYSSDKRGENHILIQFTCRLPKSPQKLQPLLGMPGNSFRIGACIPKGRLVVVRR